MTIHEIITTLAILCPAFYAFGYHDGDSGGEMETASIMAVIGCGGIISAAVAITLRFAG